MGDEQKTYLLDTSALMTDPDLLRRLQGHNIILHSLVIDELDNNKNNPKVDPTRRGNTRKALRILDELLSKSQGTTTKYGEGTLQIVLEKKGKTYTHADPALIDFLKERPEAILIAEDFGLRVKAKLRGYQSEGVRGSTVNLYDFFKIQTEIDLPEEYRAQLRTDKTLSLDLERTTFFKELFNNQYLTLSGEGLLLRYTIEGINGNLTVLPEKKMVKGIFGKNKEQKYLLDLCMREDITLSTVMGRAGTGKTLIPLAAGIQQVQDHRYKRMIIVRPTQIVGNDLGYLPGGLEDKTNPYMAAIQDAAERIYGGGGAIKKQLTEKDGFDNEGFKYLISNGLVQLETITYIRGRNIHSAYILVDEAQNLTQEEARTVATRIGEGTKIIFNGDPYQIDNPANDIESNGLVHVTRRLLGESLFSTVILTKGERSPGAELAARLL